MNKKFFFILIVISCFLSGCVSNGMMIPGEGKIILKNLSTEYYTIADGYFGIKNYEKAIEYYKLAMKNKELYLPSYYKLARSYTLAKDWGNALECFKTLQKRDPENISFKLSIAYITAMSGEIDSAILQYRNLVEENPYDESILENYVALLINVGRGEDAEKQYFVLKKSFPDNSKISTFKSKLSDIVDNFNDEEPEEENTDEGSSR